MMGETHFLTRLAAEVGYRHHAFFDKPINELTDGRMISETIGAIRKVPFVGDTMGDIMAQRTGLRGYTVWDQYTESWKHFLKVEGGANHTVGTVPWSRSLQDASSLTDEFMLSRTVSRDAEGIAGDYGEVPIFWNVLDSGTGMRIKQSDPALMRAFAEIGAEKQFEKYLESIGLLKSFRQSYIPYNK